MVTQIDEKDLFFVQDFLMKIFERSHRISLEKEIDRINKIRKEYKQLEHAGS